MLTSKERAQLRAQANALETTLMVGKGGIGGRLDVYAGAGGHIVEDHRFGGCVGDSGEHGNEAPLGGFVIIGGHYQHGIVTQLTGEFGQLNGVGGIVGAGTGDEGDPSGRSLHGKTENFPVLGIRQSGAFAGGAADD